MSEVGNRKRLFLAGSIAVLLIVVAVVGTGCGRSAASTVAARKGAPVAGSANGTLPPGASEPVSSPMRPGDPTPRPGYLPEHR